MIAAVRLPHFRLALELQRRPALRGVPVAVAAGSRMTDVVVDCSDEAAAEGVRSGMTLHTVAALCRAAVFIAHDPVLYHRQAMLLRRALEQVSPIVEVAEDGHGFLDLRGLHHLYRTTDQFVERVRRQVRRIIDSEPHLGIAENKFVADMAARHAPCGGCRIVRAREAQEFLAPLPVGLLPVPEAMIARLHRLGLKTLGSVAALPLAAVQAQFGPDGRRAWQLCHGADVERLVEQHQQPVVAQRLQFPAPVASRETLEAGVRELVARFFLRPEHEHALVQQVCLRLATESGPGWERVWTPREVLRTRERLAFFLTSKLATAELPGAVTEMTLELRAATQEAAQQGKLFQDTALLQQQVRAAVRQLATQYGSSPIRKVVEVEPWSRIPERRWALLTYEP